MGCEEPDRKSSVWMFVNSNFALWLFTAIFITGAGSVFTSWQAENTEHRKIAEYREKLDLEISYRFSQFFGQIYALSNRNDKDLKLKDGKSTSDVAQTIEGLHEPNSNKLGNLYPEFRSLGLPALLAELRRTLSGKERDAIDIAMASITNPVGFEGVDLSNLVAVATTANRMMVGRWRQHRFGFVDCLPEFPFC